ncbi:MAG TPA: CDP-diacylglycerol--glycerol-3-phosphate 3-phosphatidyltransferase [Peptococcaceae bacterium]|nr:CDP-diacylglycerol--glycerol-3-phosphate 3-phosphatidyltransferase [Peptococcaceae bacterium]
MVVLLLIPNIITAIRFILIPIFIFFMSIRQFNWAVTVFLLAVFSDFMDGYLARKYKMVTKWGKLMDPLADKLLQISGLIMIGFTGLIKNIIPILLIVGGKEILMFIGSVILLRKGIVVSSNWYGKVSTVIIYAAIILSIFAPEYGKYLLSIVVLGALFSLFMYFKTYSRHFEFLVFHRH